MWFQGYPQQRCPSWTALTEVPQLCCPSPGGRRQRPVVPRRLVSDRALAVYRQPRSLITDGAAAVDRQPRLSKKGVM